MPTIGCASVIAPVDPENEASPKLYTSPDDVTSQYPRPPGLGTNPTTADDGRCDTGNPGTDPKNPAAPNANTPPSRATSQYPPAGLWVVPGAALWVVPGGVELEVVPGAAAEMPGLGPGVAHGDGITTSPP